MMFYELDGKCYTIRRLSEISGVKEQTIRARLRKGLSVKEAVSETPLYESVAGFVKDNPTPWIEDEFVEDVYQRYYQWCLSHDLPLVGKTLFSRQICTITGLAVKVTSCNNKSIRVFRRS